MPKNDKTKPKKTEQGIKNKKMPWVKPILNFFKINTLKDYITITSSLMAFLLIFITITQLSNKPQIDIRIARKSVLVNLDKWRKGLSEAKILNTVEEIFRQNDINCSSVNHIYIDPVYTNKKNEGKTASLNMEERMLNYSKKLAGYGDIRDSTTSPLGTIKRNIILDENLDLLEYLRTKYFIMFYISAIQYKDDFLDEVVDLIKSKEQKIIAYNLLYPCKRTFTAIEVTNKGNSPAKNVLIHINTLDYHPAKLIETYKQDGIELKDDAYYYKDILIPQLYKDSSVIIIVETATYPIPTENITYSYDTVDSISDKLINSVRSGIYRVLIFVIILFLINVGFCVYDFKRNSKK